MGRTLPSITQAFLQEQDAFTDFRRALRRGDQLALDDLFISAQKHLAAAAYAAHALPLEIFLLSMVLEEHKEVMRLRQLMETRLPERSFHIGDLLAREDGLPSDDLPLDGFPPDQLE
jgi:hypothetical protein